jgi:hypothetical protein
MLSKGELGLTILVPVIVGADLLYWFYLFQTGRGCDCTMAGGGVWGSSRRCRVAEDAALQEMTDLKQMFSQLTEAQKKRQRQARSHDGVSADSGTTENVADVPNDQRDGVEEEMANRC